MMSKLSGGTSYLTKESDPARRLSTSKKSPVMVAVSAFFALMVLFMSVQPVLDSFSNSSPHTADASAGGIFCSSKIGLWMDDKADWAGPIKVYPQENEKNRVWTLQEAFGNGATFVNYEGEGGKTEENVREKSPANTFKPGNYDAVYDKLEGVRTFGSCVFPAAVSSIANVTLLAASSISSAVQTFVVFAFDSSIICSDPAHPTGVCLNLLKVIGGTGDTQGGLIGTLTGSIYMPLLVIAVTLTGLWIGYKGLVQRKLREAMFDAIWVCLSVVFGLALLLNPTLLAKAPMAVSNAVGTCIIGSFSGQNCMDSSGGTTSATNDNLSTSSSKICRSLAPGAALDGQMSMTVNSMTCSIWKAFVLEPYAQGSFGTSFENLDTVADTPTKKVIEKAGIDPNTFCVNLGTSDSLASFSGKRAVFDRDTGKVCNLLAYQMFLKTNASTTGSITPDSGAIDTRWYNVIVTAANDDGLWAQWAPSMTNSLHKNATATLALITGLAGGFILIVIAFFALVYYLTSVILMAFAPLFFLLGVHPGRGKKILMGWLEKVLSNVLKYLASALFLIVAVSFYAAILGAASNPALTFLFVVIISGALFMYRKEVIELIGKVSMGGEQLSSKFSDGLKARAAGVGGLALAGVGSGIGAAIAGGRVSSGIKAGIQRDLQRGGATKVFGKVGGELVGNAARQFARNTVDNERDIKLAATNAQNEQASADAQLATVTVEHEDAINELESFDVNFVNDRDDLDKLNDNRERLSNIETEAAREMMADNPYFAQAQLLLNSIAALNFEKDLAVMSGDTETADSKIAEMQILSSQREALLGMVDSEDLARNREEYSALTSEKMFRTNLDYSEDEENTRLEISGRLAGAQVARDGLVESANELTDRRNELVKSSVFLKGKKESLNDSAKGIQPGDMLNKKTAGQMVIDSDKAGAKAVEKAEGQRKIFAHSANKGLDEVYTDRLLSTYSSGNNDSDGPRGGGPAPTDGDRGPQGPAPTNPVPNPNTPAPGAPVDRVPAPNPTTPSGGTAPTDRLPTQPNRNSSAPSQPVTSPTAPIENVSENSGRTSESQTPESARVEPQRRSGGLPNSQGRQTAQAYESASPAQPERSPSVPTQPDNAPSVPAQPAQAPNAPQAAATPQRPESAPRVPTQPVSAPSVPAQPAQAPAAPSRAESAPRIPTQPAAAPRVSAQPEASPRVPAQPNRAPTPPVTSEASSTPAPPARQPNVPARPEREPAAPMVRDRGERQVPLAREIRLPSEPQVSRITENSQVPVVSIQRENPNNNESPTRGRGLPRRRNSRDD